MPEKFSMPIIKKNIYMLKRVFLQNDNTPPYFAILMINYFKSMFLSNEIKKEVVL